MSLELIEQNAVGVNDSYLSTIGATGKDLSFDPAQIALLYSIANQCPLLGGNPVYQARSMYILIDPNAEFEDDLLCAQQGYVVKQMEESEQIAVHVYPNPTRGDDLYVALTGPVDDEQVSVIHLYDVNGRIISTTKLSGSTGVVNITFLSQGLYQWSLEQEGVRVAQGKVTKF